MSVPLTEVEKSLRDGLVRLEGDPGPDGLQSLVHFLQLLEKWNRAFNLTGVRNLNDMAIRHVLDSATARPFLHGVSVLDVGTGPGLPGIPLAILEPGRRFVLLDSNGKKIRFLQHAVAELSLKNVQVHQGRIESYSPEQSFDTVICRALTSLRDFAQGCGRLVATGGRLVAMKGRLPRDEMAAVELPWHARAARVAVPSLDADRHIIVMER